MVGVLLMSFFFSLCFFFTITSSFMSHPFSLGTFALFFFIFSSLLVGAGFSGWYGYMMFLVFVSGIFILFAFTCALAPMYKSGKILGLKSLFSLILIIFSFYLLGWGIPFSSVLGDGVILGSSVMSNSGVLTLSYVWDLSILCLALILFSVMIVVSHMCGPHKFPLRGFTKSS